MVYEDICNFGMDQLVITQYKKILKKEAADNTWKHRAKQIKIALKNFN